MSPPGAPTTGDAQWMSRALELARRGRYTTSPNPMVGAVIVGEGTILGEGFHRIAGGPHAEIAALSDAEKRGRPSVTGAEMHVTLEPCSHHGRTPPCADALIRAGIVRVHIGALDPNPRVAGRGAERLRAAGIDVVLATGEQAKAATDLNAAFNHHIVHGTPFVTVKLAASLDGRIATASGESQWITGPEARAEVHRYRAASDAILVGRGTAMADDPRLNARGVEGPIHPPARVVVDSHLALSPEAKMLGPGALRVIATARAVDPDDSAPDDPKVAALAATGAELWSLPDASGRVDLRALFERLGARGVMSVWVEGGGVLVAALIDAGLAHRVIWHLAPLMIGAEGIPALGSLTFDRLADAPRFTLQSTRLLGRDMEVVAIPAAPSSEA